MTSLTNKTKLEPNLLPAKKDRSLFATMSLPSMCRFCHFYKFHGRSGGYCKKLGVSVDSHWRSCPLAISSFAASWEGSKEIECVKWR